MGRRSASVPSRGLLWLLLANPDSLLADIDVLSESSMIFASCPDPLSAYIITPPGGPDGSASLGQPFL